MQMQRIVACPACDSSSLREIYRHNDLTHLGNGVEESLRRSDFCLCARCGLLFAGWRQSVAEADEYYARFADLEHRWYAAYPPPEAYLRQKAEAAQRVCGLLEDLNLLQSNPSVLHLRCDVGMLLDRLRNHFGLTDLYGMDYFAGNRRFATERLGLLNIGHLSAGEFRCPFSVKQFDLIIANHQITHALQPREFLGSLRGALNPGGRVLFYNELDHEGIFDNHVAAYRRGINNYHKQLLTEKSFGNVLRLTGFEVDWFDRREPYLLALARVAEPCQASELPANDYSAFEQRFCEWARELDRALFWNRVGSKVPCRQTIGRCARGVRTLWRCMAPKAARPPIVDTSHAGNGS